MPSKQAAGILGTGSYLPEKVLTNRDLEKIVDTSDEWIVSRTGIRERRVTSEEEAASDLGLYAAEKALKEADVRPEDLDLIIVASVTPDMAFPSTACHIQTRLGAAGAAAYDLSAACAGFLYGVTNAAQCIENGLYRNVLVIGSECLSKITDWTDRNTCVLFGDGAGAVVMGPVEQGSGFLSFELGADGRGGELLKQSGGGSRDPLSEELLEKKQRFIQMNGREVFKFAVRIMSEVSESVVHKAGLRKEDVNVLVPHQANRRIIDSAMDHLELPESNVIVNLDRYGNMSSASIPVALDEAYHQGKLHPGDILVLVGFGGGLTWGGAALRWV